MSEDADDFTMLGPENTDVCVADEIKHILSWSERNELCINLTKCKELIFRRPSIKFDVLPYSLQDTECVYWVKLFGVWVDSHMTFAEHVDNNYCYYSLQSEILFVTTHEETGYK